MSLKHLISLAFLLIASTLCSGQRIQVINGDTMHMISSEQMRSVLLDKNDLDLCVKQIANLRGERTYLQGIIRVQHDMIDDLNKSISYEKNLNSEAFAYIRQLERQKRNGKILRISGLTVVGGLTVLLLLR